MGHRIFISSYGFFLDRRPNLQISVLQSAVELLAYHCIIVIKRFYGAPPRAQPFVKVGGGHVPHGSGATGKTVSLVLVVITSDLLLILVTSLISTANRTVNVLVLWSVEIKTSTIVMKLG